MTLDLWTLDLWTCEPMHLKRWLTGIIATPILIYVIGFSPRWVFHLLLFLAATQGLIEFFRIASPELPKTLRWTAYAITFLLFLLVSAGKLFLLPALLFLFAAAPMAYFMFTYHRAEHRSTEILGKAVLGPLYVAVPLTMLVIIDRFPKGKMWIFFLLIIVFACDTGAFYAGRTFGRHKLHPLVSPGKTWEGSVGGLIAGVLAAYVWSRFSSLFVFDFGVFMLAAGLSLCGQIGDLAESMLKRNHGVKDSGGILPGHGGILDRVDAHLFAIPLLFVFLSW
jgi:phosphatidate cytidylyltransferase